MDLKADEMIIAGLSTQKFEERMRMARDIANKIEAHFENTTELPTAPDVAEMLQDLADHYEVGE